MLKHSGCRLRVLQFLKRKECLLTRFKLHSIGDKPEKMSDEDAFFAVDNSMPALTGRISYVDAMTGEDSPPSSSKVTYALNANKLTKQQIMNFFKLWLICVGPTNDE